MDNTSKEQLQLQLALTEHAFTYQDNQYILINRNTIEQAVFKLDFLLANLDIIQSINKKDNIYVHIQSTPTTEWIDKNKQQFINSKQNEYFYSKDYWDIGNGKKGLYCVDTIKKQDGVVLRDKIIIDIDTDYNTPVASAEQIKDNQDFSKLLIEEIAKKQPHLSGKNVDLMCSGNGTHIRIRLPELIPLSKTTIDSFIDELLKNSELNKGTADKTFIHGDTTVKIDYAMFSNSRLTKLPNLKAHKKQKRKTIGTNETYYINNKESCFTDYDCDLNPLLIESKNKPKPKQKKVTKSPKIIQDQKLIAPEFSVDQKEPNTCLLYTSPSPRDRTRSRMPSSA